MEFKVSLNYVVNSGKPGLQSENLSQITEVWGMPTFPSYIFQLPYQMVSSPRVGPHLSLHSPHSKPSPEWISTDAFKIVFAPVAREGRSFHEAGDADGGEETAGGMILGAGMW